jgi:hypothetical protein
MLSARVWDEDTYGQRWIQWQSGRTVAVQGPNGFDELVGFDTERDLCLLKSGEFRPRDVKIMPLNLPEEAAVAFYAHGGRWDEFIGSGLPGDRDDDGTPDRPSRPQLTQGFTFISAPSTPRVETEPPFSPPRRKKQAEKGSLVE